MQWRMERDSQNRSAVATRSKRCLLRCLPDRATARPCLLPCNSRQALKSVSIYLSLIIKSAFLIILSFSFVRRTRRDVNASQTTSGRKSERPKSSIARVRAASSSWQRNYQSWCNTAFRFLTNYQIIVGINNGEIKIYEY